MAYITYYTSQNRYADFGSYGVKLYSVPVFFSEQPLNELSQTPKFAEGVFENGERLELLDAEIEKLLSEVPDAMIFPRINTSLPRAWELAHPEEMCSTFLHTVDGDERRRVCFSSDLWAQATKRLLRRFIEYAKTRPWIDHIIGWQIAGGNTDEWFSLDRKGSDGPRAREKFALAVKAGEFSDTEAEYYRFLSLMTAKRIDEFAALVKDLTDHKIVVGAFYGYTLDCTERTSNHHAMHWLLQSDNVDFYCSPISYMDVRPVGLDHSNMTAVDSTKLHGKLYFVENDTRTDLSRHPFDNHPYYQASVWLGPDREKSVEVIKQHFSRALLHGHAMWWFDMWGGWYDAPEYKALFLGFEKIAEEAMERPRASTAKVALFVDERAYAESEASYFVSLIRRNLGLVGAAYDVYLVDDFAAVADRYALCVFLVPHETERMTAAIHARPSGKMVITDENWEKEPSEWRELFRAAGVPLRTKSDAIVYENESYLFIGCEGDVQPVYDGKLEQIWNGRSKLYRKV